MKYYNLHISFEPNWKLYNEITKILNIQPVKYEKTKFDNSLDPSHWFYQIIENESDETTDFINIFLDIIEPKFDELESMKINRNDILIELVYEYEQQCAMEFHPNEMKRLGNSGICLNIDCIQKK